MIGLISALEEELMQFKDNLELEQTVTHAGIEFYIGSLAGRKVILLRSGVGKVNAAVATQLLIDRFDIKAVILTGLAGSLVQHVDRGDIVISSNVVQHDIDLTAFGRRHGEIPDLARLIEADPKLVHQAADACEQVIEGGGKARQMVVGTIATGDTFVSAPDRIRWLQREFGAVAIEMEGGAVGQACSMSRIPFVVIRVISDRAGGGAAGEFMQFLGEASELSFDIVTTLLTQLTDEKTPTISSS